MMILILMMKGHDGQGDATTQNTRRRCFRVMMMVPDLLLVFLLLLITISILIWRMDGKDHILFIDGRGSETRFHENGR